MGVGKVLLLGLWGLVSLIAVGLMFLKYNPSHRAKLFSNMCKCMSDTHSEEMMALRCGILAEATGNVLEIGPGAGVNFQCLSSNANIESWIGAEPNPFMEPFLQEKMAEATFKSSIVADSASALSIPDASVDTVISTHVLCTVPDTEGALKEIARVLKPGGKFLFLEHVLAEEESALAGLQSFIQPVWTIVGDGCRFEPVGQMIERSGAFSSVHVESFDAPMPLFLVKPHISGFALK